MPDAWIWFKQGMSGDLLRVRRTFNLSSARSRQLKHSLVGVMSVLVVLWIVWAVVEDIEAQQTPLPDNILYYALSTIAQSAAALAAILASFGLWRLGHLRELDQVREGRERRLRRVLARAKAQREYAEEKEGGAGMPAEVEQSPPSMAILHEQSLELQLTSLDAHRYFIRAEWYWLTKRLGVCLLMTLLILVLAIVGLAFVDTLFAWVHTVRTGIILASLILASGPAMVIWRAVRQSRPGTLLAVLLLVLTGALPAEAAGRQPEALWFLQRCTTIVIKC